MASEAATADRTADVGVAGYWKHAQKIFRHIQKDTSSLKRASPAEITDAKWKSLEDAMSQYRLACVGISFQDVEFAEKNQVEKALWSSHILINNIYRHVIKQLPSDMRSRIRSVESQYLRFITTSQLFYKGYIQRLSQRYNIRSLHRIASAVEVEHGPRRDTINSISPAVQAKILCSVQETLTYLGDLARYRSQLRPNGRHGESAVTYYSLAHDVAPDRGYALHQIGVTYLESDKHLDIVYYFFLSLARSTPHPNAQRNLESKLKAAQSNRTTPASSQSTQQILEGRVVQLFANYVTNTSFAGRDELEKTVLARLEQFLQSPHPTEVVVKMVLVGMGAYYYAKKRQGQSLGAMYTLSFIFQLLRTICHSIRGWVREAQGVMPGESETENSRLAALRDISPGVDTAIRVLRLLCCWLSSNAEDLESTPQPVQALVESAWKAFALTATELVSYLKPDVVAFCQRRAESSLPTAPYLMEEDEESVCYLAIGDVKSEVYRRLFHQDETTRKPTTLGFGDGVLGTEDELILCVGDIIDAARHFSESPLFPVTISADESGRWIMDYGYDLDTEPAQQQAALLPDQIKPVDTVINGNESGNDVHEAVETVEAVEAVEAVKAVEPVEPVEPLQPTGSYITDVPNDIPIPSPESRNKPQATAEVERPPVQLSPKFRPLPLNWFHVPTPTGAWTAFTRDVFESLPTGERATSRVGVTAGADGGQREMLLRMLRSASQATPQDSAPKEAIRGHGRSTLQMLYPDYAGIAHSPSHGYGTANVASPNNPVSVLHTAQSLAAMGEQLDARMLYQQDQLHHAYNAQLAQQIEQHMAAAQSTNARGSSRPRSSRGHATRRARNRVPEDSPAFAGVQSRHVQRGIGGP